MHQAEAVPGHLEPPSGLCDNYFAGAMYQAEAVPGHLPGLRLRLLAAASTGLPPEQV